MRVLSLCLLVLAATTVDAQSPVPPPAAAIDDLPGFGRPVPVDAVRARRQTAMSRLGGGVLLVPAATIMDAGSVVIQDNDFRQDDSFFYLTGLETEGAWLLVSARADGGIDETLFLPRRVPSQEVWTGKRLGPGERAAELTGIADVRELHGDSLTAAVLSALRNAGGALHLVARGAIADRPERTRWEAAWPDVRDATAALAGMRVVKDDVELAAMRRSIVITTEAQRAAMRAIRPDMAEYEIEAVIEYTFRRHGADRVAFPSIVGSGPNSTTLHYDVNRRTMRAGDLVVMDIGAEYAQYAADVTRTVPVSGVFTPRQRAVYELVLATQQAAIDAVRPGITRADLSRIARRYMAEHSAGVCPGDDCTRYFIHGLTHWLGMRVHDVGGRVPLVPGMVFTIEPGIYIPEEEIGIRIEDDILVTPEGAEVLSSGAPRSVEDIEALMRSGRNGQENGGG
jgi:Xaa-Pro aminopeptidase